MESPSAPSCRKCRVQVLCCALARESKWRAQSMAKTGKQSAVSVAAAAEEHCHWRSSAKRGIPVLLNELLSVQHRGD